jgi:large subunit ribosomal protein L17
VFSYLKNKEAVTELFRDVAPKIAERPGGYVRIIRTGLRHGDNAEMCMIELVDFNTLYGKEAAKAGAAKKRTRRGGAKKKEDGAAEGTTEAAASDAPAAEAKPKAKRATKKKDEEGSAE